MYIGLSPVSTLDQGAGSESERMKNITLFQGDTVDGNYSDSPHLVNRNSWIFLTSTYHLFCAERLVGICCLLCFMWKIAEVLLLPQVICLMLRA